MNECYLQHHGILGQKWGVRRFQNPDGSLTPAGEKRYNTDVNSKKEAYKEARKVYKETVNENANQLPTNKTITENNLRRAQMDLAKKELNDEKIKEKLNNEKSKSKHRLNLEAEYIKEGMSKEEAEIAAYKRTRTEKIIATTAGVAVATIAATAAYKIYKDRTDDFIKPDTPIRNVSIFSDKGVSDAFYAATNHHDEQKYIGLYGKQLKFENFNKPIYQMQAKVNENGIKVPSINKAVNILKEQIDSGVIEKKDVQKLLNTYNDPLDAGLLYPHIKKAVNKVNKDVIDKDVYKALNILMTTRDAETSRIKTGLFEGMKKAGYGAIVDINDEKYSGYDSRKPLIIFDGERSVDKIANVRLNDDEINKKYMTGMAFITGKQLATSVAELAATYGVSKAVTNQLASKNAESYRKKYIENYRKEHPNTELTDSEILKNYSNK